MPPINFNQPLFDFACVAFCLLAAGQTIHLFFCLYLSGKSEQGRPASFRTRMWYEGSIAAFLICTAIGYDHYNVAAINLGGLLVPMTALGCMGLVPLAFGLLSIAFGNRSRQIPLELVLFGAEPMAIFLGSGPAYLAANGLVGSLMTYRVIWNALKDQEIGRQKLTRFSIVDAVNHMPSGILCLTSKGHSLIMNEAMRTSLVSLELPIDPADLSTLWTKLMDIALTDERSFKYDERSLLLSMPDGTYHLFERSLMNWNGQEHVTITDTDVTEEEELNKLLEQSNTLIAKAGEEIKTSLEDVSRVAQNEALLSLRAKVHDIIGQRLSILHRLLEDNNITDDSLAEITPLLNNLLNDLRIETFDAQAEFDGIVSAFGLINVKLEVTGNLPQREDVAHAFVAVIREATTNAVRHAQAANVRIRFSASENEYTLFISNEYSNRQAKPGEGIGIPNMRKAVEALGGTLEIRESACFDVFAQVPNKGNQQVR